MAELQPTNRGLNTNPNRVDFQQNVFDQIIQEKGRPVLFEKALQCPCKSRDTNQQSNCKNCGGSGWLFVNATETRMVIQAMTIANDIKGWSEEARGTINISCRSFENLTYMDRISLLDSKAIFNEVLFFKKSTSDPTKYFAYSKYTIKEVLYAGLFISISDPLTKVVGTNFNFEGTNMITISTAIIEGLANLSEYSITLKYIHPPTFYVIEMKREAMESLALIGGTERNQRLPISAVGRRAHYIPDSENFTKTRINNNDYIEQPLCLTNESRV